jgi:hypothetical protein
MCYPFGQMHYPLRKSIYAGNLALNWGDDSVLPTGKQRFDFCYVNLTVAEELHFTGLDYPA